ncbi:MAG: hypothetical protein CMN91_07620 [Synechococcus sp. ARS1019]|nr:hypothetical protein [Synechococcus sp. ARS1019]|tara:strand:+ start:5447 stop:5629 length:183 start_codon:yes stop_codon:yes gene_type:complete
MNGVDLEIVATLLAAKHLDALKLKDWTLAAFSLYQLGQLDETSIMSDWSDEMEFGTELAA